MKMKIKMKNISHRYDINRPKPGYNNYKESLNMILLIYIKQHLSNTWNSTHENVKQQWLWAEKSIAWKKACV